MAAQVGSVRKGLVMGLCPQHLQLASKHFLVCPKRTTHQPVKKVKTQEGSNIGFPASDKELKSSRNSCMEYIPWTHVESGCVDASMLVGQHPFQPVFFLNSPFIYPFTSLFIFETESHIAQASLRLTMLLWLPLNSC